MFIQSLEYLIPASRIASGHLVVRVVLKEDGDAIAARLGIGPEEWVAEHGIGLSSDDAHRWVPNLEAILQLTGLPYAHSGPWLPAAAQTGEVKREK